MFCQKKPIQHLPIKLPQDCEEEAWPTCLQAEEESEAEDREQSKKVGFLWQNKSQVYT